MDKEILQNQLEKIITNINTYKADGLEKKKGINPVDFETLLNQVKNKEFVITVVGAMKSGKSSFTNALIGKDLMPNENQACTLTSTDIVHQEHDFRITKHFQSGKNEILESENLSSIFHEDVRRSRTEIQKEFYTYKVHHPIYGLIKYPFLNDINFILMDTPGLNEMEGLGVKKETIEQVFSHALKRTDLIIFILDVQYYKSEENLQTIEKIKELRPDLLDHIVFVINKVDKLRVRDGTSEDVVDKVKDFLNSWGVSTAHLYPVSARKALIGRLAQQGVSISNFRDEISAFLPTKTIEVEGQAVTVQVPISSAYLQLIEDSGILVLEEQILEETYLQAEGKLLQSSQLRLSKLTNQLETTLQKAITQNKTEIQEVKRNLHALQQRLSALESLHQEGSTNRNEIEGLVQKIRLQALTMRKEKPFTSKPTSVQEKKSTYRYSSSSEAEQIGVSKFDEWFYKNTEPKFQSILSHYQGLLQYQPTGSNHFYSIGQTVSGVLKKMNRAITAGSKQLPELKVHSLIELLDVRPQGLSNIPAVNWKYQSFSNRIISDSKTTEWEESFLIFFTQTKSRTDYMYDCSWAFKEAEKHIQGIFDKYSKEWHLETIQKRYTDIADYVQEMVFKPLTELQHTLEPLIKETTADILGLESVLAHLQAEVIEMKELKSDAGFRTDLVTRRKSITVTERKANLDTILSKAESGMTIYLEEGTFTLEQKHEVDKSFSIIGLGKSLTKIKVGKRAGITVNGNHGVFLEGVTFESTQAEHIAELNCLEFFVENCHFTGNDSQRALNIKAKTEGLIQRSSFSLFAKGITVNDFSRLRMRYSQFDSNNCGLNLMDHGQINVVENKFTANSIGVRLGGSSGGTMEKNTFTHNNVGIVASDHSTPAIVNNRFQHHKECGILVTDKANPWIDQNQLSENGNGVSCSDFSKAGISQNTFLYHQGEAVRINGHAAVELNDNRMGQNYIGILISSKGYAVLSRNQIVENRRHGVMCQQESVVTAISNHLKDNEGNGLVCEGTSRVTVQENVFSGNRNGMTLTGQSKFAVMNNQCVENKENGIAIQGESRGRIHQNQCARNQHGVYLSGKCQVLLEGNQSHHNEGSGIICHNQISGQILNNSCDGNGAFSLLLKKPLLLHLKKNSGKGRLERPLSIRYWFNQCTKLFTHLLATIKKKEIFHNEY